MPLSTLIGTSSPIELPDHLASAVKPVALCWKEYKAALAEWQKAEQACVTLRRESRRTDLADAEEALDAVRNGKPIPKAKSDAVAASVQVAERAVDAYLTLAREAEQRLLDALETHHEALDAAATDYAHQVTQRLLTAIGDVLTEQWDEYLEVQRLLVRVEMGRWGAEYGDRPIRMRYEGQDRDLSHLLGDLLRLIDRSDPKSEAIRVKIQHLMQSGGPSAYDEAVRTFESIPTPSWAAALGVDS